MNRVRKQRRKTGMVNMILGTNDAAIIFRGSGKVQIHHSRSHPSPGTSAFWGHVLSWLFANTDDAAERRDIIVEDFVRDLTEAKERIAAAAEKKKKKKGAQLDIKSGELVVVPDAYPPEEGWDDEDILGEDEDEDEEVLGFVEDPNPDRGDPNGEGIEPNDNGEAVRRWHGDDEVPRGERAHEEDPLDVLADWKEEYPDEDDGEIVLGPGDRG